MIDLFYLFVGIGFVLSLIVQGWLRSTYSKWSRVPNSRRVTGFMVARHLLNYKGLAEVDVTMQDGALTDHYDPKGKEVSLSRAIYTEPSVASAAIAAHECGHAIQDQEDYGPMRLRSAFMPVAQLGAQYGPWAVMGGWLFGASTLVLIGFLMFGASLLFQLMSLPIEFDASRRARQLLIDAGLDSEADRVGVKKVLRAAAMTYVAGSATAMGQLGVILLFAGRAFFRRLLVSAK